ncbi:MAG: hypothetical protein HKO62_08775 [Gammaproteobacteria bacterium]|nr:hypothetical protein [Gammaproteobacteria bacterium]NNM00829.1 hypothetical protein [Gammaproteobacteria bacterium]
MTDAALTEAVTEEIEALHRFFVGWFGGALPDDAALFQREFSARFDPGCVLIPPAGETLDMPLLTDRIRATYATNPSFRIAIRNVQVRHAGDDLVLATYEEWQRHAFKSTPPDNGRVATVLFARRERLTWLHVHETWLPADVMAAGPFDF